MPIHLEDREIVLKKQVIKLPRFDPTPTPVYLDTTILIKTLLIMTLLIMTLLIRTLLIMALRTLLIKTT